MWKIFVGFVAFALIALFVIMKSGDKVDIQAEAAGHSTSTPKSVSASAAVSVPPAPVESVPAATATPAASSAPSIDAAAQPRKMSTTGTVVVGATAASAAVSK